MARCALVSDCSFAIHFYHFQHKSHRATLTSGRSDPPGSGEAKEGQNGDDDDDETNDINDVVHERSPFTAGKRWLGRLVPFEKRKTPKRRSAVKEGGYMRPSLRRRPVAIS